VNTGANRRKGDTGEHGSHRKPKDNTGAQGPTGAKGDTVTQGLQEQPEPKGDTGAREPQEPKGQLGPRSTGLRRYR